MKLPFLRVRDAIPIDTKYTEESHEISLKGEINKERSLYKFVGIFEGNIELTCDSCSEEYQNSVNDEITLWFSDGEYSSSGNNDDNRDVIEFFDGFIDFDEVIISEIESIKLDYHKCKTCEQNPMED